ncbi:hypothetical protein PIIN_08595 [Serendipita indica DSM 11827]|uniref:Uncharacterized protein n=1 Tax=Serendipita indica (strain DSM 11827) TaxID=1109443 RepID=G4TTK0_SERID|nr:hypothetical protein PIIN_08595 [Serendipita indica DSM 11827]
MASAAHDKGVKTDKPKKVVVNVVCPPRLLCRITLSIALLAFVNHSYGRGGGNFRKVSEKKYATETSKTPSTARKVLEVEPPRMKMAVSTGRGGAANYFPHVLEEGVFDRVMEYEMTRIQVYKSQQAAKRTRRRTNSNVKSSKASSIGSDDAASQARISLRRSWASKSTVDVTAHSASLSPPMSSPITQNRPEARKSLRDTLLAPLRTTFTRAPRPSSTHAVTKDDTSSFSACSLSEPHFPMDDSMSPVASPVELHSPSSPNAGSYVHLPAHGHASVGYSPTLSDEAYSAILTPSTAEFFGELGASAVAARYQQANGMLTRLSGSRAYLLKVSLLRPCPLPRPPLPPVPVPTISINGRTSLPPLPRHPTFAPPHPDEATPPSLPPLSSSHPTQSAMKTRIAAGGISIKHLQANPVPILRVPAPPRSRSGSSLASVSSRDAEARYERLAATSSPPGIIRPPGDANEDGMELKLSRLRLTTDLPSPERYNNSTAASSCLELPIPRSQKRTKIHASREASCYDDSDVDRIDPFLTSRGQGNTATEGEPQYLTIRGVDSVRVGKRQENVEGMPWRNASILFSGSNISIPSFSDSNPELVAA